MSRDGGREQRLRRRKEHTMESILITASAFRHRGRAANPPQKLAGNLYCLADKVPRGGTRAGFHDQEPWSNGKLTAAQIDHFSRGGRLRGIHKYLWCPQSPISSINIGLIRFFSDFSRNLISCQDCRRIDAMNLAWKLQRRSRSVKEALRLFVVLRSISEVLQ